MSDLMTGLPKRDAVSRVSYENSSACRCFQPQRLERMTTTLHKFPSPLLGRRTLTSQPRRTLCSLHSIEEHRAEATRKQERVVFVFIHLILRIHDGHIVLYLALGILVIREESERLDTSRGRRSIRVRGRLVCWPPRYRWSRDGLRRDEPLNGHVWHLDVL